MKRTWDENRHHRERVIAKRVHIIRDIWQVSDDYIHEDQIVGLHYGALSKHNLVCSCPMCRGPRYDRHKDRWADDVAA